MLVLSETKNKVTKITYKEKYFLEFFRSLGSGSLYKKGDSGHLDLFLALGI